MPSTAPWLGPIPPIRTERHLDGRLVRCFVDRPPTVDAMLREAVAARPDAEALVADDQRTTYRALDSFVGRLAGGLAASGIAVGDRVALLLANSAESVIALLAILRLGAVAVPLNIREGPTELAFVLADCGARMLLYSSELAGSLPPPEVTPALAQSHAVGRPDGPDSLARLAGPRAAPPASIGEADLATLLYTSGTTGRPKGAMQTHLGLVHSAMIYEACMGLGPDDCSLAAVPLSHVTGLTANIGAMLRAKGKLVVMRAFKADAFLALAAAEGMTQTVMVPAMYALCLMSPAFVAAHLSRWRIGGYGGAPMPTATIDALAARLPGLRLMNAYGSTETTGPVVLMPPAESAARAASVGRPVPVVDVLVMDAQGREVPTGESGEIWLKGPNVVAGYWGNPAATADAFVEGYWRSGDIGRQDAQGYLTLLDRAKDMINRGGFKVYSVEVENVLTSYPGIAEAAIVGRPCPVLGERVHAFVVPRDAACPPDMAALRRHAASQLADYKVPEIIDILDEPLPRNAAGKVLKRELRART